MVNIDKVSAAASGLALLGLLSMSTGFSVSLVVRPSFRTTLLTPLYAAAEDNEDDNVPENEDREPTPEDREKLEKLFHLRADEAFGDYEDKYDDINDPIPTYGKLIFDNEVTYEKLTKNNELLRLKLKPLREIWAQKHFALGEDYNTVMADDAPEFIEALEAAEALRNTMQQVEKGGLTKAGQEAAEVLKRYKETLKTFPLAKYDLVPFIAEFRQIQDAFKKSEIDEKALLEATAMLHRAIDVAEEGTEGKELVRHYADFIAENELIHNMILHEQPKLRATIETLRAVWKDSHKQLNGRDFERRTIADDDEALVQAVKAAETYRQAMRDAHDEGSQGVNRKTIKF